MHLKPTDMCLDDPNPWTEPVSVALGPDSVVGSVPDGESITGWHDVRVSDLSKEFQSRLLDSGKAEERWKQFKKWLPTLREQSFSPTIGQIESKMEELERK